MFNFVENLNLWPANTIKMSMITINALNPKPTENDGDCYGISSMKNCNVVKTVLKPSKHPNP